MLNKERINQRKSDFKKGIDLEEGRKKREEITVSIRKKKKEEQVSKRRNIQLPMFAGVDPRPADPSALETLDQELPQLVSDVFSNDLTRQLQSTERIRKLLSIEKNPPIQKIVNVKVVPRLVQLLAVDESPQLQFEAAWALTNIASGSSEQTRVVIEANAVPYFVHLLSSANEEVREQAVWALGNIAGDSAAYRDYVLANKIMPPLLQNLVDSHKLSMLRNATWTLSNLCRGKPQPKWEIVSQSLPTLSRLIYSTDEEVLTDACWALSYLSDGPNDRIQQVIDAGVCRRLVDLLMHGSFAVQTPALRTIGNIVTGDDTQTQFVLNIGILPCLHSLLSSPKKGIRKEACWTISNITAGNSAQIQTIVDADIFPPLIHLLGSAEFDIKKEAAWAISNATSGGSIDQLRYLVAHGIVKPLCDLLEFPDPKIIMVALEGLENLLRVGPKGPTAGNEVATQIEEYGGVHKLEALQRHQANEIYEKVIKILENYFEAEEDDQNIAPDVNQNTQTYAFGSNNPNVPNTFQFN